MSDLKIIYDKNGVFSEYSKELNTFLRDSVQLPLETTDYIYIGLYKPFGNIYIESKIANEETATLTAEYNNGTTWTIIDDFEDNTNSFERSGFVTWKREQVSWSESTVNGETMFWIRLKPSVNLTNTLELQGINIVFADDFDLREGYYTIEDLKPSNANSFISFHQAARNEIVQDIRNSGKIKVNSGNLMDITKWDILRPEQLKEAGKWKALELVFDDMSNEVGDKYDSLSKKEMKKYKNAMNLYLLSLDADDNGIEDESEKQYLQFIKLKRY